MKVWPMRRLFGAARRVVWSTVSESQFLKASIHFLNPIYMCRMLAVVSDTNLDDP